METKNSSKHIILKSCEKLDDSLLVKLVSGASGEHVDVVDVRSAEIDYSYDGDKAWNAFVIVLRTRGYVYANLR